ncbi:hypothetical protein D3C72_2359860 [compost metagenome]
MSISKKTNALVLSENSKAMIYKDLAKHSAMPRGRLASIRQAIVDPAAGLLHCGIHSTGVRHGHLELPQE